MPKHLLMFIVNMLTPLLIKVAKELMEDGTFNNLRIIFRQRLMLLAAKTSTPVDDWCVERLFPVILSSENVEQHAGDILKPLRVYISSTETKWDDEILIPLIDGLESALTKRKG
jgi:hypothetical protein